MKFHFSGSEIRSLYLPPDLWRITPEGGGPPPTHNPLWKPEGRSNTFRKLHCVCPKTLLHFRGIEVAVEGDHRAAAPRCSGETSRMQQVFWGGGSRSTPTAPTGSARGGGACALVPHDGTAARARTRRHCWIATLLLRGILWSASIQCLPFYDYQHYI